MRKIKREAQICGICINNSGHPPRQEVHCYWKKHEKLDVRDTCKYFYRGSTLTIVPVNNCFRLTLPDEDTLLVIPSYAVHFLEHDFLKSGFTNEFAYDEQGGINSISGVFYDANLDLILDEFLADSTLTDLINYYDKITYHSRISDAMAQRYPAMGIAREILDQRAIEKAT